VFKGFILKESLTDSSILDSLSVIYVTKEKHNDPDYPPVWHLYKVKVKDKEIRKVVEKLAKTIKER